jgi:two-component system NtrC family sensor kinase
MPDPESIKILCIDDEINVLHALERFFLDDEYEIVTATCGQEGLRILEDQGPFRIVISDYRMPVMNGVEFLKEVYLRWPETIRIVLSGYADAGSIVAAINEGHIYKFIPKPWNEEELRFTVNSSLERYQLQRTNRELLTALSRANEELEQKIRERTADLELRNTAMLFSQLLLNALPVGVVGIDANGMIAQCNQAAFEIMHQLCGDFIGGDISQCSCPELRELVWALQNGGVRTAEITIGSQRVLVTGTSFTAIGSEAIVLVFQER